MNIIRARLASHIHQAKPIALTLICNARDVYMYRGFVPIRLILCGHYRATVYLAWRDSKPIQETFWGDL